MGTPFHFDEALENHTVLHRSAGEGEQTRRHPLAEVIRGTFVASVAQLSATSVCGGTCLKHTKCRARIQVEEK